MLNNFNKEQIPRPLNISFQERVGQKWTFKHPEKKHIWMSSLSIENGKNWPKNYRADNTFKGARYNHHAPSVQIRLTLKVNKTKTSYNPL